MPAPRATTGGRPYTDVSVRPCVRSHVPGTERPGRADEAGNGKAKLLNLTCSEGIRLWAVFKNGSAPEPSQLARELHGEGLRRSHVARSAAARRGQPPGR